MKSLMLTDIGSLAVVPRGPISGRRMAEIEFIRNAALVIDGGRIAWFGRAQEQPGSFAGQRLSARGGTVLPGLIDCHTHIPFCGDRRGEFVRRIAGESYLSIMQAGGGIRVTTNAVRAASLDGLVEASLPRLARMLALGVTTVECKSGYGLSPEHELKQLRAVRELAARQPIELIPTYLGAHALPAEFENRAADFLAAIADAGLLKQIADERLARFIDVFCDRGAFDVQQARRVLLAGANAGLKAKVHADELAQIGASRLAGELRAVSADHLETIDEDGLESLKSGGVVAVVLPGTSFFLGIHHADARRIMNADVPLALATDCNPGSSHIESLPLVLNIACCQLRLRPSEALAAATANAAAAIDAADRIGAIAIGHQADLTVLDAVDIDDWMYSPGRNRTAMVIKSGRVVFSQT
ncbi:MAG: imidazolonepropionase [Planctomycetes bacterium]|nr:imidazolonepropionase [Planctomycetota bacterium]